LWVQWHPQLTVHERIGLTIVIKPYILTAAATATLLLSGAASASGTIPHNTLVYHGGSEPAIAVDPRLPGSVTVAAIGGPGNKTYPIGLFHSQNQGHTFSVGALPLPAPYTSADDPTLAFSSNGTMFSAAIIETASYCGGPQRSGAIAVATSSNDGKTYHAPVLVDVTSSDDKPSMTVESIPGHLSHVFVVWTYYHNGDQIMESRSTDGGVTFGPPQLVAVPPGENIGPQPVVGPKGHVYVFWSGLAETSLTTPGKGQIFMARSTDDGVSFAPAQNVSGAFSSIARMTEPYDLRTVTFPSATVTPSGRLYLTWAEVRSDHGSGVEDTSIMLSTSSNSGKTWTAPVAVNDAITGDRFMPGITTLARGTVGIAWYDRRAGSNSMDIYAARATFKHGLKVSRNVRVSDTSTHPTDLYEAKPGQSQCFSPGRFFGDYLAATAAPKNTMYVTWGADQAHTYATNDLWIARVHLPARYRATP
jgi:hypothetical protein